VPATTGLTSPGGRWTGGRFSSDSWLSRRLAHVFGRHDLVPFQVYDEINEAMVWSRSQICTLCGREVL
jgi:hypothetical protein